MRHALFTRLVLSGLPRAVSSLLSLFSRPSGRAGPCWPFLWLSVSGFAWGLPLPKFAAVAALDYFVAYVVTTDVGT